MSTRGTPDFNQWLTRVHGFKVGASRNSYTVADLEYAWNAAERVWMEVANKNAQERNAAVDREVVLLEALRPFADLLDEEGLVHMEECHFGSGDFVIQAADIRRARAAIKQTERT